ncbi:hypothetical protein C2W59_00061 [Bacillus pumilus]|nr:hypothetical protein C2W59_00061 [Bacillus pumilus]
MWRSALREHLEEGAKPHQKTPFTAKGACSFFIHWRAQK